MIITLIFVALFVVALIALIIVVTKGWNWYYQDFGEIIATIVMVTGAVGSIVFGIVVGCTNARVNQNFVILKYEEKVQELNITYENLEVNYDVIAVQAYNEAVSEFKADIKQKQLKLNNPWVNWFTCAAYRNFDANAVKYYELH